MKRGWGENDGFFLLCCQQANKTFVLRRTKKNGGEKNGGRGKQSFHFPCFNRERVELFFALLVDEEVLEGVLLGGLARGEVRVCGVALLWFYV